MLLDIGVNGFSLIDLVEGHGEIWVIGLLLKGEDFEGLRLKFADCNDDLLVEASVPPLNNAVQANIHVM